jgi:Short C-terminal domain
MSHITRRCLGLVFAFLLVFMITAGPASAQASSEEAQGTQLLQSVQNGQKSCGDLTSGDFELMGEAWMGQMFGSPQAHESMNRLMSSMMGASGEREMHEFMGRRVSGCGGGSLPSGFDQMMNGVRGMTGMMAMMGGAGAGMMGAQGGSMMGGQSGYGSMMNGNANQTSDGDNDVSGWVVAGMVAILALFLVGFYFVLRGARSARSGSSPEEILRRRLAAGEISQDDYERRLGVLGGGK